MKKITGGVTAPKGFTAAGIHCGIRNNQTKKDLALLYSEVPCNAAAVYTPVSYTHLDVYKRQVKGTESIDSSSFLRGELDANMICCIKTVLSIKKCVRVDCTKSPHLLQGKSHIFAKG